MTRSHPGTHLRVPTRRRIRVTILALPLLLFGVIPPAAGAQQPAPPGSGPSAPPEERELIQQLLRRVDELEAEVKALKAERVKSPAPPEAPVPPPGGEHPIGVPPPEEEHRLQIRGFSDIDFSTSNRKGSTSSFTLGQLDLFITSRLSDKFSVLDENVIEANDENAFGFEIERLLLQYSASDYLHLAAGRYHTAIGWYSTAYHHGTWLQTATGRPFLFAFEDEGGILPIHNVGLSASGSIPSGQLGLRYTAEIGNGRTSRSRTAEPVQNVIDENNTKALNFALQARPDAVPGLQVGGSFYIDRLRPEGSPSIRETIPAGYLIYQTPAFEWLNEGLVVRHKVRGGKSFNTGAFYTQIARQFGKFRPYFRYQYVNAPEDEPIYKDVGFRHGPSFGVRYDPSDSTALKLQYDRTDRRSQKGFDTLTLQSAFTF
jgi:hypothetical protein